MGSRRRQTDNSPQRREWVKRTAMQPAGPSPDGFLFLSGGLFFEEVRYGVGSPSARGAGLVSFTSPFAIQSSAD